jgi:hypothetical protein
MFRLDISDKEKTISPEMREVVKSTFLIEVLYNLYLPKKIEIGQNIWRFIVTLTFDKNFNEKSEISGLCHDYTFFIDYNLFASLNNFDRKEKLLTLFSDALKKCCKKYNYPFDEFQKIEQKIRKDNILFNTYFKEKKSSPNKKRAAQLKAFFSEEYDNRQVFVSIFEKDNQVEKTILIGHYDFRNFDTLKWVNNETIYVYHINIIQSYKSKKVADDHFIINIDAETVTYNPVTRESIFDYGVKLLTETNEYEKAINLIHQAKELGHGKADNILRNLKINYFVTDAKTKIIRATYLTADLFEQNLFGYGLVNYILGDPNSYYQHILLFTDSAFIDSISFSSILKA